LQHTITIVEGGLKFVFVLFTSLKNHLYGVVLSKCKNKSNVFEKAK
jgi:hypothetical protein